MEWKEKGRIKDQKNIECKGKSNRKKRNKERREGRRKVGKKRRESFSESLSMYHMLINNFMNLKIWHNAL